MRIEEERQDVLQNLEFAVARLYQMHPEMTDYAVLRRMKPCCRPTPPKSRADHRSRLWQRE